MCERQDELSDLDTRIRTMRAAPDVVQLEVRRMEAEAKKRLEALRTALERNPKEARAVIQAAFDGKLTATPVMTTSGPRFQIEGTASLGRMLALEQDSSPPDRVNKNPPGLRVSPGGTSRYGRPAPLAVGER